MESRGVLKGEEGEHWKERRGGTGWREEVALNREGGSLIGEEGEH